MASVYLLHGIPLPPFLPASFGSVAGDLCLLMIRNHRPISFAVIQVPLPLHRVLDHFLTSLCPDFARQALCSKIRGSDLIAIHIPVGTRLLH